MPKHQKTHSRPKTLYRVKNWKAYEQALVQRGSLTFWLGKDFEQIWKYAGEKQRGSQYDYSEQAIVVMQTLKNLFHLPNRATEGLVRSIFAMLKISLSIPDHSTLSRRGKGLRIRLPKKVSGPVHIVLDSTGLKLYGEGEWKVWQHGFSKWRTWRKLHIGLDPNSGEIQAAGLTSHSVSDDQMLAPLLAQVEQPIEALIGDGSYDTRKVYDYLKQHLPNAKVLIPPRPSARIWQHGNTKAAPLHRDDNLRAIRKLGKKTWKQTSGYHARSLVETTMFRLKTIFGDHLSARLFETQVTQAFVRCAALNRMTHLGMPETYRVA